jgi:hypothetical protein
MSILVVEVLSEGLIFGADRNITSTYPDGRTSQEDRRPKVLKWPDKNHLFGFVGVAEIGGKPMHEWLETLTEEFKTKTSLKEISNHLNTKVQEQLSKGSKTSPLIIHIGGFEKKDGYWIPQVWFVRNVYGVGHFGYLDFRNEFSCGDAFIEHFKDIHPSEIRKVLKVKAKKLQPFWFHQGIDLFTFNVLQDAIKSSFKLLCENHPEHDIPRTLDEWSKHVRMQVLMYGAYYEAFHEKGKQYVGGGVDIVSLPWPD